MTLEQLQSLDSNKSFHEFIQQNINADVNALRLKKNPELSFDSKFAILQIECKNRIKRKLPTIFNHDNFFFPNLISTEQCTAEKIAQFHASLLNPDDNVLDMTGGLCIDTFYISQRVANVTAIELDQTIATVSAHNMAAFAPNVTVINADSTQYIKECQCQYDVVFIDPARRGSNNKRLYGMTDCTPDVVALLPQIQRISSTLYIKASPMIDISQSISDLGNLVSDVWVLSINNECKELLFKVILNADKQPSYSIHTINFEHTHTQHFDINSSHHECPVNSYDTCTCSYLYEPNSSIMKAQLFDSLSHKYNLPQLQKNSHLYIGKNLISDFPGRCFSIISIIPFNNKETKKLSSQYPQINVSVRNFKLSADQLKNKLRVKDGGEFYLFGTTLHDNSAVLIICQKAK